ncbi:hypothetical protein REPUB_Repub17cG0035500 [Reevesia pubescens]
MERVAERGKAIAAAVEGVEKNWGTSFLFKGYTDAVIAQNLPLDSRDYSSGEDGEIVAVVDVIHITHAAVATLSQVGSTSVMNNEAATTMMQKFWDSAMALPPNEDDDETQSENSLNPIS